jgi:hypothetical protein
MSFTTKVVSLNPDHASCTRYQSYAIKFVSDLRQVGRLIHSLKTYDSTVLVYKSGNCRLNHIWINEHTQRVFTMCKNILLQVTS